MNIRERRAIHTTAKTVLDRSPEARKIALVYGAVCCGLSLVATVISALLGQKISGTGGLGNIGLRSVLSTGQSVLPLANLIITTCLSLGYHTAILCFTRGYDAGTHTLTSGFHHVGAIIRTMLLQALIYSGAGFAAMYLSTFIFMATPFSADFMAVIESYVESLTVLDTTLVLDESLLVAASEAIVPMLWILGAVSLVLVLPLYYRFRMTLFCLADDPRLGAIHALVKSRKLMRRNCFALFRLDLTFWKFYLGQLLVTLVCYGDVLLPMMGVTLPWSNAVSYYVFFGISLVMQLAVYYFLMNPAYAAYAVAYDALQEELPEPQNPVQM